MTRVEHLRLAESFPRHTLSILTVEDGHREVTWDPNDEGSVALATREFNSAKADGRVAVDVGENGQGAEVISEFDPSARTIVMHPPLKGG